MALSKFDGSSLLIDLGFGIISSNVDNMNCSLVSLLICVIWINSSHIGGIQATPGVLDDALFTFQEHACENDKLTIHCPYGTTINIKWAQFGRTQPQNEICPFSGNFWNLAQQTENVQCLASTALQVVLDQCQDRHRCRILASTTVFGQDPCPTVSKYLEVSYKCRPNEFRSRVVCDGEELPLHCSKKERLAIYSASFGWSQQSQWASECADYASYMRDCDSSCAYRHVYSRCHGHKRCTLLAQDANFHSNCQAGTPKYLEIVYTCVKKRILQDINDDVEHPDPCELETPTPPISNPGNEGTEDYNYGNQEGRGVVEEIIPNEGGTDINGQPSYLPKHSTISYDQPLTPQPEVIGTDNGNHGDSESEVEGGAWSPETDEMTEEPETGAIQDGVTGFMSDWIFTWNFLKENTEKLIMYVVLGVLVGIICVLLVIIIRLNQLRRRGKREAKLNISEPIANSTAAQAAETTSLLEPSDQSDGVEMTSYNQIGSMHRPPVSSFTDPYEEETPVTFAATPINRDPHGTFGRANPQSPEAFVSATMPNNNHGSGYPRNNHHHGNGAGNASITRPNHTRQTSFSGSLGRSTQPGTLTGSLNRRDHWTNEYRNEGHSHTLQHYYG